MTSLTLRRWEFYAGPVGVIQKSDKRKHRIHLHVGQHSSAKLLNTETDPTSFKRFECWFDHILTYPYPIIVLQILIYQNMKSSTTREYIEKIQFNGKYQLSVEKPCSSCKTATVKPSMYRVTGIIGKLAGSSFLLATSTKGLRSLELIACNISSSFLLFFP